MDKEAAEGDLDIARLMHADTDRGGGVLLHAADKGARGIVQRGDRRADALRGLGRANIFAAVHEDRNGADGDSGLFGDILNCRLEKLAHSAELFIQNKVFYYLLSSVYHSAMGRVNTFSYQLQLPSAFVLRRGGRGLPELLCRERRPIGLA